MADVQKTEINERILTKPKKSEIEKCLRLKRGDM